MTLPSLPRGRPTKDMSAVYRSGLNAFCDRIKEIESRLDFHVSSRGWAYILENEGVITKGEFDQAQKLINDCRKSGDLPLEMQVKLLRLLQEREFRPVGSLATKKVQIRVMAATHRDLAREVGNKNFRLDLFYRLNVVSLRLPPLRDRPEDIPGLVACFLERLGSKHKLGQDALEIFMSYDWPGNVRELQNCIERMVAMNSGPVLQTADLPSALQMHLEALRSLSASAAAAGAGVSVTRPQTASQSGIIPLTEMEKHAIRQALEYTKGDRVMAAYLLGIGRTTLYRKLKEYRLVS